LQRRGAKDGTVSSTPRFVRRPRSAATRCRQASPEPHRDEVGPPCPRQAALDPAALRRRFANHAAPRPAM
jgi:hypothetical protein